MKAAVIHTFGQAPRFEELPEPTPSEGEVMITTRAAGLYPLVKALANGSHYGSTHKLPLIPGVDGIGTLDDGTRVYFGMMVAPCGSFAERVAVPREMCIAIPDSLDDVTAAAIFNPGLSSWFAFTERARLVPGETVLILGATGAAGKMAVQIAKFFGAGKVIVLGRNEQVLGTLAEFGADVMISLDQPEQDLIEAITRAAGSTGIHVIIDYLWGRPTESVITAITRRGMTQTVPRVRLVEVGQMAGPTITLPASVLRSSALEIYGSGGGTISLEQIMEGIPQFIDYAATGKPRIDTYTVSLAEVEDVWQRQIDDNRRLVFVF